MTTSATQHILDDEEKEVLLGRYVDFKFVDDVTELSCKRCGHVLIHHYVANCGHLFCKNCQRVLSNGKGWKCPQCEEYITHIGEQRAEVEERVLGLMVHCLNHKYGCKLTMTLQQIPKHLKCCEETREANLPRLLYADTYTPEAGSDRVQAMSEMINNMTETMNQKFKEMEDRQRAENEIKWKELENRMSTDFQREMIKLQSQITDSHTDVIKNFNSKLSKMEETVNQHAEETERVKEKMEKWMNNIYILVETTELQTKTADSCNQMIGEVEEKATHLKQHMDEIRTETKASLLKKLQDIEEKLVSLVLDNSQRQDFQTKLDELSAEMGKPVDEMKMAKAQMSDEQNKRAPLNKTDVHQGMNVSTLDLSKQEMKTLEMKKPEDSNVPKYNILLLGESGSGKSTFINALANYIQHEELKDALSGGPARCLIPTTIVVADDNYQSKIIPIQITEDCEVKVGEPNPTGRTYILNYDQWQLRLFETSGYGQNNGARLNVDILKFISDCKFDCKSDIVIAVVAKSSQSQLNPHLIDLFQSLLSNTSIRVLFLYSHSETTDNYRPGNVIKPLKQLLAVKNLPPGVSLSVYDTYSFDNKGFLYLLGKQSGHSYGAQFEDSCHRAWNSSALECLRLLQSLTSNRIKSTISRQLTDNLLFNFQAKQCYQLCSDYMKQISDNNKKIQVDLDIAKKDKIDLSDELNNRLQHVETYSEVKKTKVSPPQYVCQSNKCREDIKTRDGSVQHHYPQKCPTASQWDVFNQNCSLCGCRKKEHTSLPYTTKIEERRIDPETNPDVIEIRSEIESISQQVDQIEKAINEYTTIESICNAFRQKASQLDKTHHTGPKVWERSTFRPNPSNSCDQLIDLKKQLFDLELNGLKIKEYFHQMEAID